MKNYFLAIGVVSLSSVFAFPVSAQESETVVPRTNWSFDVLKQLSNEVDLSNCRPNETSVGWSDFYNDDFTLTRQKAALATLRIAHLLKQGDSGDTILDFMRRRKEYNPNRCVIKDLEATDAMQALSIEYHDEIKNCGMSDGWLQELLNPKENAAQ